MTTRAQTDANNFDADLYRLVLRAERERDGNWNNAAKAVWRNVISNLRAARSEVRKLMSDSDRAATAG